MSLPPELIEAVIRQESGGNPNAVSPRGAVGLMQIMPDTARDPGFGVRPLPANMLRDPEANRAFGTEYLTTMVKRYNGDIPRALVAYNWGPGNADKWDGRMESLPAETRDYVRNITGSLGQGGGVQVADASGAQGGLKRVTDPALLEILNAPQAAPSGAPAGLRKVTDPETLRMLNAPEPQPTQPGKAEPWTAAGTLMLNDLNAGFQGISPVGAAKAMPIGEVIRGPNGEIRAIRIDGADEDPSRFTPDKYATQIDPATGGELLYQRTPEIDAGPLESAGRVLGYGLPTPTGINTPPGGVSPSAGRPVGVVAGVGVGERLPAPPPVQSAAEALGVAPSLGMRGNLGAKVAGSLEASAATRGPVVADAERATGQISAAAERTADMAGRGATRQDAGTALRQGAEDFKENFVAKSGKLYDDVRAYIPPGSTAPAGNTQAFLRQNLAVFDNVPNIARSVGNAGFKGWLDDIDANGGALSYEQMAALRTSVGEALGNISGPMADKSQGALKQLYGALSRDMEAAARAAGPRALAAFTRANNYYRAGQQRIEQALDLAFKAKGPEGAYESTMALAAGKGARANVSKLNSIKKSMDPEQWGTFVSTAIRRMGIPTPGAAGAEEGFSAATFLTEWNKLDPAAKAVMFSGGGLPSGLRPALENLAKVAEQAKRAGGQTNVSRSGAVAADLALAGALGADAMTGFTSGPAILAVIANVSARAMTSPKFVNALASLGRGTKQGLVRLAAGDGPDAIEAANVLRLLEQTSAQPE